MIKSNPLPALDHWSQAFHLLALYLMLFASVSAAQGQAGPGTVTQKLIEATASEVSQDSDLAETQRAELLEKLKGAESSLARASLLAQREKELQLVVANAPERTKDLKRRLMEDATEQPSLRDIIGTTPTLEAINTETSLIEADLQKKTTVRSSLRDEILAEKDRDSTNQSRLVELNSEIAEFTTSAISTTAPLDERVDSLLALSNRQLLIAEQSKLRTQINAAPLLAVQRRAERDWLEREVESAQSRLDVLSDAADLYQNLRTAQVLQSIDELDVRIQREAQEFQPLLDENRTLAEQQLIITGEIDNARASAVRLTAELEVVNRGMQLLKQRLDVAGNKDELGPHMAALLESLPDTHSLEQEIELNDTRISQLSLKLIDYEEQIQDAQRPERYLNTDKALVDTLDKNSLRFLAPVLEQREQILRQSMESDERLLRILIENNRTADAILRDSINFRDLLVGNLLWVRNYSNISLEKLQRQLGILFSSKDWLRLPGQLGSSLVDSLRGIISLLVLMLTALVAQRSRPALERQMSRPIPISTMRPADILLPVAWALLIVLPVPMAVYLSANLLKTVEPGSLFLDAIIPAMLSTVPALYTLLWLPLLLGDKGLGRRRLKWNAGVISTLALEARWFIPLFLCLYFRGILCRQSGDHTRRRPAGGFGDTDCWGGTNCGFTAPVAQPDDTRTARRQGNTF